MTTESTGRVHGPALAVLLVLVALVHRPLLSDDAVRLSHDAAEIHLPDAQHVALAAERGAWVPLWSPHVQSGAALYAVPTKPFAYPPFVPAARWLGPVLGFNLLTLAHALLAAVGAARLLARLGLGGFAQAAGGALFVLAVYPGSLLMSAPAWGWAVAWWPWLLHAAHDLADGRRAARASLVLAATLALGLLAGGAFPTWWIGCFLIGWLLARGLGAPRVLPRAAFGLLVAGALGAALAAVKLLPSLAWIETSGRGAPLADAEIFATYEEIDALGAGPRPLAVLHAMYALPGRALVGSLALAALGLAAAWRRPAVRAALGGVLVCLLLATGLAHDVARAVLPGYDRMRMPYRLVFPAGLGVTVLAAHGLEACARLARGRRTPSRARAVGGGLALAALAVALLAELRALPFVRDGRYAFGSLSARVEAARPTYAPIVEQGGRLHDEVSRELPVWLALGLRATGGLLGGPGSAHAAYERWLPFTSSVMELETTRRAVLDVLAAEWLASVTPLELPHLEPVLSPPGARGRDAPTATDGFVARLLPGDAGFETCGFVGGPGMDVASGVARDARGLLHVVGHTNSPPDGEPTGPLGTPDAMLVSLSPDAATALLATRRGGADLDWALDVAAAPDGTLWLTGRTRSTRGWGPGATRGGARDVFVLKVAPGREADATRSPTGPWIVLWPDGPWTLQAPTHLTFFGPRGVDLVLLGEDERAWALRLEPLGADDAMRRAPASLLRARVHRLRGPPEAWRRDVATAGAVAYAGAWPGVTVRHDLEGDAHEPRLTVSFEAGATARTVAWRCEGATGARVEPDGTLRLATPLGVLAWSAPRGAHDDGRPVPAAWRIVAPAEPGAGLEVRLALGEHDPARPLEVASATRITRAGEAGTPAAPAGPPRPGDVLAAAHLGGAGDDRGKAAALAPDGRLLVAGHTTSHGATAPTRPGPARWPLAGDADVLLVEIAADGSELLSWTTLGGEGGDFAQGLAVDTRGRAYLTGSTRSHETSFPVVAGPGTVFAGVEDAFVAKLDPRGADVTFCGYLGGADGDYGQGVAVHDDGRIVLVGDTKSGPDSFPVRGGPSATFGGLADAFVASLSADGRSILTCGYLGGDGVDVPYAVALDRRGRACLAGVTRSGEDTFPVVGGPQLIHGGGTWDGFVARVAADGSRLETCGFVGGSGTDIASDLLVDARDRIVVVGQTLSDERSFPVVRGPGRTFGGPRPAEPIAAGGPFEPFRPRHVYRRLGARAPVTFVRAPILVVGEPGARRTAMRAVLGRPNHDARATVLVDAGEGPVPASAAVLRARTDASGAEDSPRSAGERVVVAREPWGELREPEGLDPAARRPAPVDPARVEHAGRRLAVDVAGLGEGWLVLAETFALHPGWTARIDGVPAPLAIADGVATAVRVPAGAARLDLEYALPGLRAGALVSVLALLVLVLAWRRTGRRA